MFWPFRREEAPCPPPLCLEPPMPLETAIATYDLPPLQDKHIMALCRDVARSILSERKHAHPYLPDDLYDVMRKWCATNRVRKPAGGRDTFLEAFRQLPNVKKRRVTTLDEDEHDFVYARMQERGHFVPRPVLYYISEEKQRPDLTDLSVDIAWLSQGSRVVPFEPREKSRVSRGPKKSRKNSIRRAA